jgi:hypothetical protein
VAFPPTNPTGTGSEEVAETVERRHPLGRRGVLGAARDGDREEAERVAGYTLRRRGVLAAALAASAGLLVSSRRGAVTGSDRPESVTMARSWRESVGGRSGVFAPARAPAVGSRSARVGRWPGGDRIPDWARLRADPAYAWAAGAGWSMPVRPIAHGPLAGTPVLPRGGRTVFPRYRLMGFCGLPGAAALGRLGVGRLADRVAHLERLAHRYADGRQPLPVLELIVTVAQGAAGRDGMFRVRVPPAVIEEHLAQARRSGALLLLNVQPGRARFLDEIRALASWLREPDVGVALDPEWAVGPGQRPGEVFGHVMGAELDAVAGFLQGLVAHGGLPEKVMVVHQLTPSVIRQEQALREHPGVVMIKSVDGIGSPAAKTATWRRLVKGMPPMLHPGFKLFFDEDTRGGSPLMTPEQVLALTPTPEYVLYE